MEYDLNKYTSNNFKGSVLEVDLEYPKELLELHSDYPFTPDKIDIKRKMLSNLSNYQRLHNNWFLQYSCW